MAVTTTRGEITKVVIEDEDEGYEDAFIFKPSGKGIQVEVLYDTDEYYWQMKKDEMIAVRDLINQVLEEQHG